MKQIAHANGALLIAHTTPQRRLIGKGRKEEEGGGGRYAAAAISVSFEVGNTLDTSACSSRPSLYRTERERESGEKETDRTICHGSHQSLLKISSL